MERIARYLFPLLTFISTQCLFEQTNHNSLCFSYIVKKLHHENSKKGYFPISHELSLNLPKLELPSTITLLPKPSKPLTAIIGPNSLLPLSTRLFIQSFNHSIIQSFNQLFNQQLYTFISCIFPC